MFSGLAAGNRYVVTEPSGEAPLRARESEPAPLFARSDGFTAVRHGEERFDDFARQPLLPNRLSQSGPAMAWGDIDRDGDADGFLGGSAGRAGQVFVNSGGTFAPSAQPALDADRRPEDAAAVFFDADGDGDLDLFVASGSVEHEPGDAAYRDRLYLNDGSGRLAAAAEGALPDLRESGGAVAAADFDRDGDPDLFVGARSVPGRYPETPRSALLRNDGSGRFTDATPEPLARTGMVTGAVWSDTDGDGWPDLVVAHEWGPVKRFANQGGEIGGGTALPGSGSGWWAGIAAGDVNGDGRPDFAVGNTGLNTKYKADPRSPALLYYADFDNSGSLDVVEAKSDGTALYPRRGLSCSSQAMPFIREKLGTFHAFATAALGEIYPLETATRLEADTLESGVFLSDGAGGYRFRPFPRLAQIAPSSGVALADLDRDGDLDCVLAQNSSAPQRETGRMDGGLSAVLLGDGAGGFEPLWPDRSGVGVPGDAGGVAAVDLDGDGRLDLVFAVNRAQAEGFASRAP
jgi:hypothetical protein